MLKRLLILFGFFFLISCSEKRIKDIDEIVLSENIQEKNGFYHYGDCEEHIGNLYNGKNYYYHENGKIKGNFTLNNGVPEGHWEQFNSDGTKKIDIYFKEGKVIKKIKHN
jgi:antitoxin component YwqK of YwqJK toxin-antitoxin module